MLANQNQGNFLSEQVDKSGLKTNMDEIITSPMTFIQIKETYALWH